MIENVYGFRAASPAVSEARRRRGEMSFEHQVLWQNLRGHRMLGLGFRRMHPVEGYIVDFFCHAQRLAVEVRGSAIDQDGEYDSYKDLTLAASGIRIIRFTRSEVRYQLPRVLDRLRDACSC